MGGGEEGERGRGGEGKEEEEEKGCGWFHWGGAGGEKRGGRDGGLFQQPTAYVPVVNAFGEVDASEEKIPLWKNPPKATYARGEERAMLRQSYARLVPSCTSCLMPRCCVKSTTECHG